VETTTDFVPGLQLSERFFHQAVEPILSDHFPNLRYGAGRFGQGSEVLGFDTPRSMDHDWGPQLALFIAEADFSDDLATEIRRVMADELPFEVDGFPTHFRTPEVDGGHMTSTRQRPLVHKVRPTTARRFFDRYLGANPLDGELAPDQWLVMPEQRLRTVASGGVFRDDVHELEQARAVLRWYPHDVWLYVLAAEWRRIGQEEAFPGRCAEVGDELGSRIVAARLVREIMKLSLLMERQYAPYSKWLGSAFARLACAPRLRPALQGALAATTWPEREQHLSTAYETVADMHNALAITEPRPTTVSPYYGRPFQVIHSDRFCEAIEARITDQAIKQLPRHVGSISQWADSTDVLDYSAWWQPLRTAYQGVAPPG
jgi:hypothetical protein